MTSNETPAPGTDGNARDGKRMVYIDEAAREANLEGIEERMKGVAGPLVMLGGERMAPGDDRPRRFVEKGAAEPSAHLTHLESEPFGMSERWAARMATTPPTEPGVLKDGESIYGPEGGGKMTVAESLAMLEAHKAARCE